MEAAVVLDLEEKPLHWHLPKGRTAGSLPDDRDIEEPGDRLWPVLLENRGRVAGLAHSHPGGGVPGPSWEDVTTFSAVERALGRLKWWIISIDAVVLCEYSGPGKYDYSITQVDEAPWVAELRRHSYGS